MGQSIVQHLEKIAGITPRKPDSGRIFNVSPRLKIRELQNHWKRLVKDGDSTTRERFLTALTTTAVHRELKKREVRGDSYTGLVSLKEKG